MLLPDRAAAGRLLARMLLPYKGSDALVLALPRGGVVVACEIARELDLVLDVFVTRKIGAPGNPEYAIGALSEGGAPRFNERELEALRISDDYLARVIATERREMERRAALYRSGRGLPEISGRTVILVDDGIATGFTVMASITALRARSVARLVLAVPVAPPSTAATLRLQVDELVCVATPEPFFAVGAWYSSFEQVSDAEVQSALRDCARRSPSAVDAADDKPS